ncbi:SOS response-associated peptidase family protein [Verrucomicrobiaceae bacterium 227]
MCNAFNSAQDPSKIRFQEATGFVNRLIRRTDQAPVLLPGGETVSMRWGFERKGLGVVNNTRSDNLESPMWKNAFAERPCLVPLLSYYEWSGSKGHKRTHRFRAPDDRWLFAAGIWEESTALGPCFSMITTEANSLVRPIHHRMPALLVASEREAYLGGELNLFAPGAELLVVENSVNPLLKNPPGHIQEDLF